MSKVSSDTSLTGEAAYFSADQRVVACSNQDIVYGFGSAARDDEPVIMQVSDFGDRFWDYAAWDPRTESFLFDADWSIGMKQHAVLRCLIIGCLIGASITARAQVGSQTREVSTAYFDEARPQQPNAPPHSPPSAAQAGQSAEDLAKKLSNPVASLISVPFQSNFDFDVGLHSDGFRYTMNFQPVIPITLDKNWNLISRTILPIIHQSNITASRTDQTGLGDTVQSFFLSPAKTVPFIWGVGPALLIPTATDDLLGSGKFGLGPTVVVLKQNGGWTYGALVNHLWSVAGGEGRPYVNSTFFQPFISYTTKTAWTYGLNMESTYDWRASQWSIPIHVQASKLVRYGKQPVSYAGSLRCWATSPSNGPQGCGFRLVATLLFPKK